MRNAMNRDDYLMRAYEFAPRGEAVKHSSLKEANILEIRAAVEKREDLRAHIVESLSNEALAKKFGVHVSTIEKVIRYQTWRHVHG